MTKHWLFIELDSRAFDLHYRTGPRYGQQVADLTPSGKIGVAKYRAEQAKVRERMEPRGGAAP